MTPPAVEPLLARMAEALAPLNAQSPLYVGIHTGGVLVAERLHQLNGIKEPLGTLDISFYRDDFSRIGLNPQVRASELPVSVAERQLVLIDDVLHTGRTVRAALNEIFSYGRPDAVRLAVLIERPGRELPLAADVIGEHLDLPEETNVELIYSGKALELKLVTRP